jgi:hypothetical protein
VAGVARRVPRGQVPAGLVAARPQKETGRGGWSSEVAELAVRFGWHVRSKDLALMGGFDAQLPGLLFHPVIAYRSEPGWPDDTFIRRSDRRLIFAELKSDAAASKLKPRQRQVLELLRTLAFDREAFIEQLATVIQTASGRHLSEGARARLAANLPSIEVYVWRPSDYEQVIEVLR